MRDYCNRMEVEAIVCTHWSDGGAGAEALARHVAELADSGAARFAPLYPLGLPLAQKIETIAARIYRAGGVAYSARAARDLKRFEKEGWGGLPVCMAKTPYSFSADESLRGAPEGFILPVREVRLSAGAGFVVAICGEVMTMPGLPRAPAAARIHLAPDGKIAGLS